MNRTDGPRIVARLGTCFLAASIHAFAAAPITEAAVVHMDNGDRLTGRVIDLREGALTLEPDWTTGAGTVEVDWNALVDLSSDAPLTLELDDGSRLRGTVEPAEPVGDARRLAVRVDGVEDPVLVELARITAINPPERGVRVTGDASAGLIVNRGNTETRSLYVEGEAVARTERNRYTLGVQATRAEDDGRTTSDSSRGWMEYDHFVSERWYLATTALLTRDEFQDLRLRSSIAFSTGYQFLEGPNTDLSTELGASYVDEDFIDATDDAYPAARWSLDLRHRLTGDRVELFHFHEGFLDLENGGDPLIRSKTGVRFNLLGGFIATTQVNFDYDGDPAAGRENEDWRYLVNLGLEW